MYLIDTNVISELRKQNKANSGVKSFFAQVQKRRDPVYMSVITLGELRRGIELIRHRNDLNQAIQLENWLASILESFSENILSFAEVEAEVWGKLRVPNYEHAIDKLIAATALVYDLTVVTRNTADFSSTGVKLLNPFE